MKEGAGFSSVSPLKLAKDLKNKDGDVLYAYILRNGKMSIKCSNEVFKLRSQ